MNIRDLLQSHPSPTKVEIELNKIFETVDFGEALFQGWFSIDCYDKDNNHRISIIYQWGHHDKWVYTITWSGKKPTYNLFEPLDP